MLNDTAACSKCGFEGTKTVKYCPGNFYIHPFDEDHYCTLEGEHMHVQCARCGYHWTEAPLDAVTTKET